MKNILFITWDGSQTSYIKGLLMPIFQEIAKRGDYQFHVVQFTWADDKKIAQTQAVADQMGIQYYTEKIHKKHVMSIRSFHTSFLVYKNILRKTHNLYHYPESVSIMGEAGYQRGRHNCTKER